MKPEPQKVNVKHTKSDTLQGEEEARVKVKKRLHHKVNKVRLHVLQMLRELDEEIDNQSAG